MPDFYENEYRKRMPTVVNSSQRTAYIFLSVCFFAMLSIGLGRVAAQQTTPPLPPFTADTLVIVPGTAVHFLIDSTAPQIRYLFLAQQKDMITLNAQRTASDGILVLKLLASDGTTMLDEAQANNVAGDQTQLQFPVTVDGWYWLEAALDPDSGGDAGSFDLTLGGTTPYLMTLVPSQFPLNGMISAHMVDLFTLTSSPTVTVTLTASNTLTASSTPTATATNTDTLTPSITETATITLTPSSTTRPSPTKILSRTPTLKPTRNTATPVGLYVGGQARVHVINPNGLSLRSSPTVGDNLVENIPDGSLVSILGGPVRGNDNPYIWWNVESPTENQGWAVESANGVITLIPQ